MAVGSLFHTIIPGLTRFKWLVSSNKIGLQMAGIRQLCTSHQAYLGTKLYYHRS
uniref:Uncharacterized protein n=1 Tax=Arundo donax TaxID=35708 RepID=A0A0A8YNH5_ARUDO